MPEPPLRSFTRLLSDGVARFPDRVAVVDPALERTVAYRELADLVGGAAGRLRGHGLEPGDRVAVLARNGLEQAVAILACAQAGLVHLGLPVDLPPVRLREVLDMARPRLLLAQPDLADLAADLVDPTDPRPCPVEEVTDLLRPGGRPGAGAAEDADRTYALICTSGSTGRPKLVRLTGTMTDTAARTYTSLLGLGPDDRTAVHLPMWWVSGHVTQLAGALSSGGAVVTMPAWSAGELVRVVAVHRVTWLDLVPTLWHGVLRQDGFRADRLPSLRAAVFGGAPASPEVLTAVRDRMPGLELYDAYAMSELPAPITCLTDAEAARRPGSVGRAQPHVRLRLVGADGSSVATGEQGAVAVRSPALTPGYDSPDVLAVDDAGWFRTGDLGRTDEEGFLTITGRAADVLVRGGLSIHPVEVERALVASGLVTQALVVGVPSRLHGDDVAAVVVLPDDGASGTGAPGGQGGTGALDVGALRAAVRAAVGAHAVPGRVLSVPALPRNGNGKPDRAAARELFAGPTGPAPRPVPLD